ENMTRGPWVISKSSQPFGGDVEMHDSSFGWRFVKPKMKELYGTEAMGETAEHLADIQQISREDQDAFALWSQQKAAAVKQEMSKDIAPVLIPRRKQDPLVFAVDEFAKPHTTDR